MEIVMPREPDCRACRTILAEELHPGSEAMQHVLRELGHEALSVWADSPNRRFYSPGAVKYSTTEIPGGLDVPTRYSVELVYTLEPMMHAILAEQAAIRADRNRSRLMSTPPPVTLTMSTEER